MNNPLSSPSTPPLDPDYAARDRKERRRFWGSLAVAIIAICGATWAVVGTQEAKTEITQIQHSACAANPASLECQKIKAESDIHQPIVFACIPIRKIAKDKRLLALTKCKEAAERAEQNSGSKGVVDTNGNSPSSQPGPPSSGPSESPEASTPSGSGESAPPSSPVSETKPEPAPPEPAPKTPVRETVESLAPTVEGVKEAVCEVNALGVRICLP